VPRRRQGGEAARTQKRQEAVESAPPQAGQFVRGRKLPGRDIHPVGAEGKMVRTVTAMMSLMMRLG